MTTHPHTSARADRIKRAVIHALIDPIAALDPLAQEIAAAAPGRHAARTQLEARQLIADAMDDCEVFDEGFTPRVADAVLRLPAASVKARDLALAGLDAKPYAYWVRRTIEELKDWQH